MTGRMRFETFWRVVDQAIGDDDAEKLAMLAEAEPRVAQSDDVYPTLAVARDVLRE
jgi:hypothetical protein